MSAQHEPRRVYPGYVYTNTHSNPHCPFNTRFGTETEGNEIRSSQRKKTKPPEENSNESDSYSLYTPCLLPAPSR
jgi:hypothetical protein